MKQTLAALLAMALLSAMAANDLKQVVETQRLDPSASAELQAFRQKVAMANPGLDVVKIEADVVKRAVLAPSSHATPTLAIFVKNHTKVPGMDDEVDGIRDRLAAEISGLGLSVMDSAEIGAAFSRYKITTKEEREGLVSGLFTGGSVTRVAQMIGADYVLAASIVGANSVKRMAGDRQVIVYTLRLSTKVLDAATGASVYGKNWSGRRPTPVQDKVEDDEALVHYNDLTDDWVAEIGEELANSAKEWRRSTDSGALVSFTVRTTLDDVFRPLEATVDASKPVKDELRVVAGGCTVEVDGAAVGCSGGVFKVRPGLHQVRVTRAWMTPWTGTVSIAEGTSLNVALELSEEGSRHYRDKETLRAELALSYAEAAFRRGCRVTLDSSAWHDVTLTHVGKEFNVMPVAPVIQTPRVQSSDAK